MHNFSLIKQRRAHKSKEKGFVLLLTMLIVSVILSISLSIFSLTIKEVQLSTFLRDSEKAFVAADRGLECVLFWDRILPTQSGGLQYTPFPTSTSYTAINISSVQCNTGSASVQLDDVGTTGWVVSALGATTGTTDFHLTFSDGTYVEVTVTKSGIDTSIISRGYHTSDISNERRTQRTILAQYNL